MIVECITNRPDGFLAEAEKAHIKQNVHLDRLDIKIGQRYIVYGVVFLSGFPWYLMCADEGDDYPIPHYAGFFKVIDASVPSGWVFEWRSGAWPDGAFIPHDWHTPRFFEELLDGSADAQDRFKQARAGMDSEAAVSRHNAR